MLNFIDISNHQGSGLALPSILPNVDAVVCKATEGTSFVDPYCDKWVQQCKAAGKPWGFYHFAGDGDPKMEADFFIHNCENYFDVGIPILDWEGKQSVEWVNEFVEYLHYRTHVWPWIYANPWRFNQGGVNPNCARWVASYPTVTSPTFAQAATWDAPEADGNVVAWQFCSDGRVSGYDGNLDCSVFYGNISEWNAYAAGDGVSSEKPAQKPADTPSLGQVNVHYALHVLGGAWWPEVLNETDYAGAPYTKHDMLLMYVDKGIIRYRTHGTDGKWRDWVTGGDYSDAVDGMAGDWNVPIDGVQCEYITPDGYKYQYAYYKAQTTQRTGWLAEVRDTEDYAGWFTEPLDRFMIRIGE